MCRADRPRRAPGVALRAHRAVLGPAALELFAAGDAAAAACAGAPLEDVVAAAPPLPPPGETTTDAAAAPPRAAGDTAMLRVATLLGLGLMGSIFAQTVWSIGWDTAYGGHFWCDVVGR